MAKISGLDFYLAEIDLSALLYDLNLSMGCQTHPDADWDDSVAILQAGLNQASCSGTARYTTGATGTDTLLHGKLGSLVGPVSLVMGTTEGNTAFVVDGLKTTYSTATGAAGDRHVVAFSVESAGDMVIGRHMTTQSATGSSGNSTGLQLGTLDAGERIYSALHVTSGSGGNLTVTVESDDNSGFTSATTRITHTVATGATSELSSLAGAVATDDWWRSEWTISAGTFTFVHIMGIMEGV